jgi:hypothetical protein
VGWHLSQCNKDAEAVTGITVAGRINKNHQLGSFLETFLISGFRVSVKVHYLWEVL